MSIKFKEQVVDIDSIIVSDTRMREDFGDIDELAEDIKKHGQINPITVTKDLRLIAGERRYLAMKLIDRKTIRVSVPSRELTPVEELILEHTENVKRKDFTWQEQTEAEAMFSKQCKEDGIVRMKDIAAKLNISVASLSISTQLYAAKQVHPEVWQCAGKHSAYKLMKKQLETSLLAEKINRRREQIEEATENEDKVDGVVTALDINKQLLAVQERAQKSVRHGDFLEHYQELEDSSIDLVLLDPPWGVEIDKTRAVQKTKAFDDSKEQAFELLDKLLEVLYAKLSDNAIILLFFPIDLEFYTLVDKLATKHNYRREKTPMIWFKAMQTVKNSNPHGSPGVVYEPIYFLVKGQPYIHNPVTNVYLAKLPTNRVHATQKPLELYTSLIKDFTSAGDTVLDPTYGSGASLGAAARCGDRNFIGWDSNELCYVYAIDLVTQELLARKNLEVQASKEE